MASAGESARGPDGAVKSRGRLNLEFTAPPSERQLVWLQIAVREQPLDHFVDAARDVRDPRAHALLEEDALLGTEASVLRFHFNDEQPRREDAEPREGR